MPTWKARNVPAPALGQATRVAVDGKEIAVFNRGGQLFAIDAKCTHVGGPLEKGPVSDHAVVCPWHASRFDLATGAVTRGPASRPVTAYRVTVESDGLLFEAP
jgi:nitrite reductase/ring-hydroxylating ferredoxin subunit